MNIVANDTRYDFHARYTLFAEPHSTKSAALGKTQARESGSLEGFYSARRIIG